MTIQCKNICQRLEYESKKLVRNITKSPYKKCSRCCLCIKYEGIFCPCCGVKLSNRAKNNSSRKRRLDAV